MFDILYEELARIYIFGDRYDITVGLILFCLGIALIGGMIENRYGIVRRFKARRAEKKSVKRPIEVKEAKASK